MATLGTKLGRLRREKKLTQEQIAEKLNVSQNAYNKWENDKAKPSMENIVKLAEFMMPAYMISLMIKHLTLII